MNRALRTNRVLNKSPFLLFEVLIALLILITCFFPLVKAPIVLYRWEVEELEKIERSNLADWTFSEVKERLYLGQISWNELPTKEAKTVKFPLPEAKIKLFDRERVIGRSFSLKCKKEKVDDSSIYRIYEMKVFFTPALRDKSSLYEYRLIVRKIKE